MNDDQPTQPLTGCELDDIEGRWLRYVALRDPDSMETSVHDVPDLLAEVDRLRAENHGVTDENSALLRKLEEQYRLRAENARLRAELATTHMWLDELEAAAGYGSLADVLADYEERGLSGNHATRLRSKRVKSMAATITEETAWRHQYLTDIESERDRLQEELEGWKDNAEDTLRMYDKLKMESVGTALGHLAKIKRLQSERDALVRKLGLDWGPDEFGDLSEVPTEGTADRSEMLSDLQWYISDLGPEHWQNCDVGDEDCYLCAGHVAIRDRWKGVK